MSPQTSTCKILYLTCKDTSQAEEIVETLLAEKLIACANVLAPMTSYYTWEGKPQKEQEIPVILKTTESAIPAATTRIKELHSYDCPCVVTIDINGGNAEYLDWVQGEVSCNS